MTPPKHTAHTPGPWRVEQFDWDDRSQDGDVNYFATVYGKTEKGHDFILADMCGTETGTYAKSQGEADAKLIAAAPDMYEALKACMEWIANTVESGAIEEFDHENVGVWKLAEAAIHKAED